jgi:hypothetical protein
VNWRLGSEGGAINTSGLCCLRPKRELEWNLWSREKKKKGRDRQKDREKWRDRRKYNPPERKTERHGVLMTPTST